MKTVYFFSGLHPILESIIKYPPEDYKILSNASCSDFDILKDTYRNSLLKSTATKLYNFFEQPRLIYSTKKCDLIHTTSGVIPLNRKPFVVSVEYYSSFVGLQHDKALMDNYWKNTKRYLSAKNCKKIMPFSEASKKSIINAFKPTSSDFLDKLEVLYPAIESNYCNRSFDNNNKIRILHIGGGFFEKGGRELFRAVDIINSEYGFNIELCSITNAPPHYQEHFRKFVNIFRNKKNFSIIENRVPRDILIKNYYSKSDIFVLPSYGDFFGYVFLEAMSTGLPLIGTDVFAIPEIIEDGANGFLVKAPITPYKENYLRKNSEEVKDYLNKVVYGEFPDLVDDLVEKLLILIENPDIRHKMGLKNYDLVKNGKFSIIARNNKLKRIYNEALI